MRTTQQPTALAACGPDLVFAAPVRWSVLAVAAAVGALIVAAAPLVPDTSDGYLLGLVGAAAPFATAGLWFTWRSLQAGPPSYRPFWRWWLVAAATAYAAGAAALFGVLVSSSPLLVLAVVLLVAAVPFWVAASVQMLQVQAGQRTISVDLLDAGTALAVFAVPAILLGAEPMLRADHPAFVAPFLASVALVPAGLYLSLVSLARLPRGDRATQGIGIALGGAFAVNCSVQIAHVLSDFTLGMSLVLFFQVLNMGLLMTVPLWAHRSSSSVLSDLPPAEQVRGADPLAFVTAGVLPILALSAWVSRDQRPWGLALLLAVLVIVVLLGTIRHAAQSGETRRLHAEVALVAEERRRLVAGMVRALEDDRASVAAELHVQAVESFAALGALVQTAYVTLPPDSARAVKEAISHVQHDLSTRADTLRRLTSALRPPAFAHVDAGAGEPAVLATALRAFAADAAGGRSVQAVRIDVDPDLVLDWATTTIVYRIAQEAIMNAARHAGASTIDVEVLAQDAAIVVRVTDDGVGFGPIGPTNGSGMARMRLLAELGGGTLDVESAPGGGTVVRSLLSGGLAEAGSDRGGALARARRLDERPPPAGPQLLLVHGDADEVTDVTPR